MKRRLNGKFKYFIIIIFLIILLLYFIGFIEVNNKKENGIIVLAYHHFLPQKDKEEYWPNNYYVMATEKFEEQMKYLKDNNYTSIEPEKIECYIKKECTIPDKSFVVTIDDGNISSYYEALPILEKYGFNSINFIISGRIEETSKDLKNYDLGVFYYLGKDLLNDINDNHKTMIIASHSDNLHGLNENNNKLYTTKNYEELLIDAVNSKQKLFNALYYAYPFGETNDTYKKSVEDAGYALAFKFNDNRKLTNNEDLYTLPRIDIRANMSLNEFKNKIEGKKSIITYTKDILKSIISIFKK